MHIHEYQAKKILRQYGIPVPDFAVVSSMDEVEGVIQELSLENETILKVQIHAGGRGKAGGVKLAKNREEIFRYAQDLLQKRVVNQQTGPEGIVARKLLLSPAIRFKKEYYLGAIIDAQTAEGVIIASPEGGVEIEEVARRSPEKILTLPIGNEGTVRNYQVVQLLKFMGWDWDRFKEVKKLLQGFAKAFVSTDSMLMEINPLVLSDEGNLLALDAKMTIDDNALFRQPELNSFYDETQVSSLEAEAKKYDLSYIPMDGSIGCMVNGAGLAMATMDIIKYYGGSPANFLDVGGGASKEKVAEGFSIILRDPKVKAILVNIFGGIMNCETMAEGILASIRKYSLHIPLVVRLEGTNVENGRSLLQHSKLNIITANSLAEAAEKAVQAAR